jgi:hypothetical protein
MSDAIHTFDSMASAGKRSRMLWKGLNLPGPFRLVNDVDVLAGTHPRLIVQGIEGGTVAFSRTELGARVIRLSNDFGDESIVVKLAGSDAYPLAASDASDA